MVNLLKDHVVVFHRQEGWPCQRFHDKNYEQPLPYLRILRDATKDKETESERGEGHEERKNADAEHKASRCLEWQVFESNRLVLARWLNYLYIDSQTKGGAWDEEETLLDRVEILAIVKEFIAKQSNHYELSDEADNEADPEVHSLLAKADYFDQDDEADEEKRNRCQFHRRLEVPLRQVVLESCYTNNHEDGEK